MKYFELVEFDSWSRMLKSMCIRVKASINSTKMMLPSWATSSLYIK